MWGRRDEGGRGRRARRRWPLPPPPPSPLSLTPSSASWVSHTALTSAQVDTGKMEKETWSAWRSIWGDEEERVRGAFRARATLPPPSRRYNESRSARGEAHGAGGRPRRRPASNGAGDRCAPRQRRCAPAAASSSAEGDRVTDHGLGRGARPRGGPPRRGAGDDGRARAPRRRHRPARPAAHATTPPLPSLLPAGCGPRTPSRLPAPTQRRPPSCRPTGRRPP